MFRPWPSRLPLRLLPRQWRRPSFQSAAPTAEKQPAAAPSATTAAQPPSTNAAAPTTEKEPAPAAPTVTQVPASNAAAPTSEKEPAEAPSATTVAQAPSTNAAAPTAEKEPALAAPMVTQTPRTNATPKARENEPATKPDEATSEPNAKATAEPTSLKPGSSMKDLVAALNGSVINFGSGSAELPTSGATFLQNAADDLKQMPAGLVLEIAGYTDNTGDAAMNVALSRRRADAVREALVKSARQCGYAGREGLWQRRSDRQQRYARGTAPEPSYRVQFLRTPDRH